jgi:LysM repeat protein
MTIIGRDRERFGFQPRPDVRPFAFDSIFVDFSIPLEEIAKLGTSSLDELSRMSPHLLRGVTPSGGYWLWVPAGEGQRMQIAYHAAEFKSDFGVARYTVRWGDTLSGLAARSGVSAARIRELNPGVNFDRLLAGAVIDLPQGGVDRIAVRTAGDGTPAPSVASTPTAPRASQTAMQAAAAGPGADLATGSRLSSTAPPDGRAATGSGTAGARQSTYRVRAGDSLWSIATVNGVTVDEIREANSLSSSVIRPGQDLKIPSSGASGGSTRPTSTVYVVRDGDTLWEIARRHGSSIEAIQRANSLGQRPIMAGQRLTVPL